MEHCTVTNRNIPQNHKGFSLIEVLVVVIILGITAAVAAPSLRGWYDQERVKNSSKGIRTALEQARSNAARLSKNCEVKIVSDVDYYTVTSDTQGCVLETVLIPQDSIVVTRTSGTLSDPIVFDFKGETAVSSNATFVISRKGNGGSAIAGTGKCIVISSPLGMIRYGDFIGSNCVNTENLKYDG